MGSDIVDSGLSAPRKIMAAPEGTGAPLTDTFPFTVPLGPPPPPQPDATSMTARIPQAANPPTRFAVHMTDSPLIALKGEATRTRLLNAASEVTHRLSIVASREAFDGQQIGRIGQEMRTAVGQQDHQAAGVFRDQRIVGTLVLANAR